MKKLVKPAISDFDQQANALSELGSEHCTCYTKGWWADDDKDEILF